MKNLAALLVIIILAFSCTEDQDDNETIIITSETIVKGHVSDIDRNINIENFKIVLIRTWDDWSIVQYAPGIEVIDSVRTDSNGNYSIKFDFIHGENYGFLKQYYGSPYYTESIGNTRIIEGNVNIRNVNAWYPTILKLNLNITNNDYPAFRISSHVNSNNSLHFATIDIFEQNADTIAYIRTKPNSDIELNFHYSTGNSNADYHHHIEELSTTLQDTISKTYSIDCLSF